jgi:hypothetical protein
LKRGWSLTVSGCNPKKAAEAQKAGILEDHIYTVLDTVTLLKDRVPCEKLLKLRSSYSGSNRYKGEWHS